MSPPGPPKDLLQLIQSQKHGQGHAQDPAGDSDAQGPRPLALCARVPGQRKAAKDRQKQAGPMAGQTGKQRTQGAGRRQEPMARVVRVTRARRGVRARMDAGAVERMRRQLVTRDVERARAGVVEERFGDG